MASVHDVMLYICKQLQDGPAISASKLAKMVYLADWRSAIEHNRQMTDIEWETGYVGITENDIVKIASEHDAFEVSLCTICGNCTATISARKGSALPQLSKEDTEVIDHVVRVTRSMDWDQFTGLVYSTYPIVTQPSACKLDLVRLARLYKQGRKHFAVK